MADKRTELSGSGNNFDTAFEAAIIASNAETDSIVRKFSSHRETLLNILRGARTESFPDPSLCEAAEQHTWNNLILAAKLHSGMQRRRTYETVESQEREKIKQTRASIRKARLLLEGHIKSAQNLANEIPLFLVAPNDASFHHFLLRAEIENLLPWLDAIERAAELDIKSKRPRGRPDGTSTLLNAEWLIPHLGYVYRAYSLRVPEAKATGDFHKLVTAFLRAVGYLRSGPEGLVDAIERGIASSLDRDVNSPFLDSQIDFPTDKCWKFVAPDGAEIEMVGYLPGPR